MNVLYPIAFEFPAVGGETPYGKLRSLGDILTTECQLRTYKVRQSYPK